MDDRYVGNASSSDEKVFESVDSARQRSGIDRAFPRVAGNDRGSRRSVCTQGAVMLRRMSLVFAVTSLLLFAGAPNSKADSCDIGDTCQIQQSLPNCTASAHIDFHTVVGSWHISWQDQNGGDLGGGLNGDCPSGSCDWSADAYTSVPVTIATATLTWRVQSLEDLPYFYDGYCQ
jgi:hypothetical protein